MQFLGDGATAASLQRSLFKLYVCVSWLTRVQTQTWTQSPTVPVLCYKADVVFYKCTRVHAHKHTRVLDCAVAVHFHPNT